MSYVMNAWYPAAWADEIGTEPFARTMLDEPIVFFRQEDGTAVALEDRCCHKFLPLSLGQVKQGCIECGYHGLTFDGSGTCVRIPGQPKIPGNAKVKAYPVAEKLGLVWIWPGDPSLADKDKLFDLPEYDMPEWGVNKGPYTYVKSAYQQVTDNLLDPAHVSFVHLSSLGSPDMEDIPVATEQHDSSVEVRRWTLDKPPVPIFEKFYKSKGNVDRWQYYWFHAPSINVVDFGIGPIGMDHSEEARDSNTRIYSCHFLAPETAGSTHYFWMQARNFEPDSESVSNTMTEEIALAFDEDIEILEAVQASFDRDPDRPPVKLAIDNGPNRSRRIVDRLIRDEQAALAQAAE
jgi:phenylpropionate dioxygenase-like ring-hydroxylating dioxygenase large terminal subunit